MKVPERKTLTLFATYPYLSSSHVWKALFARSSKSYVSEALKGLTDEGFLVKGALPTITPGNPPGYWRLAAKGWRFLGQQGSPFRGEGGGSFLPHTLACTDALMAFAFLEEEGVEIVSLVHDLTLKRQRVTIQTPTGDTKRYAPDGWVDLRLPAGRMGMALEVDLDTEREAVFTQKLEMILGFIESGGYEAFGGKSVTVCFLVPDGLRRVKQLISWTEKVLSSHGRQDLADFFWFQGRDPARVIPPRWEPGAGVELTVRQYFGDPCWLRPFDPHPTPFFGGEEA